MSKVRRYDAVARYVINANSKIVGPFFWENPMGSFVEYKDYAALLEENQRLRACAWEVCDKWEHSVHGKVEWHQIADLREASGHGKEEQL